MALYLIQASYTAEALATLAKNPQDRTPGVAAVAEKLGGRLLHLFYALGDSNIVGIIDLPDATAATAAALAIVSPGHLRSYKTTPLLTVQEAMEGMRKAGELTYQAPKG
jgi:uncharacterized protein with GYD domain